MEWTAGRPEIQPLPKKLRESVPWRRMTAQMVVHPVNVVLREIAPTAFATKLKRVRIYERWANQVW